MFAEYTRTPFAQNKHMQTPRIKGLHIPTKPYKIVFTHTILRYYFATFAVPDTNTRYFRDILKRNSTIWRA